MSRFRLLLLLTLIQPLSADTATIRGAAGSATADVTVSVIVDSDLDGLTDAQEDLDGDGIVDPGETDPKNADTDGDGLTDKAEVDAGKDPLVNQFTNDPDWSFMPSTIVSKLKAFWDFESFNDTTKRFTSRNNTRVATAMPLAQGSSVWNQNSGMLGKSASVGGGSLYLEIHPDNIWVSHKNWNVSFTAKFAASPQQNSVVPLFSVFTSSSSNENINQPPYLQISLVNGSSIQNPSVSGLILRLHGTGGLYGEWSVPSDVDLSEWNDFSFNSNGTYYGDDRWCAINGDKLSLIVPVSIGWSTLANGPSDANYGYILIGATKTATGVLSVSPIGISVDRLGIASHLSSTQVTEITTRDTDGDGATDRTEVTNGTDPCHNDTNNDDDRDGLTNAEETAGQKTFNGVLKVFGVTQKNNFDSDGDLFDDYWEARYFKAGAVDPNNGNLPVKTADYDGDGLSNWDEFVNGTCPIAVDSNGNGVIDADEIAASKDTDGDGISDKDEADYGSNPTDGTDKPFNWRAFYGDENLGSFDPIGDLGVVLKAGGEDAPAVVVQVGDDSGSHSERWRLRIGSKEVVSELFGVLSDLTSLTLDHTKYHQVSLEHVATKSGDPTDYDYTATIKPKSGSPFLVCDPEQLLGTHIQNGVTTDTSWQEKTAYLVPLDGYSWATSYSGGDAVGPRYRKVALNGRPIPDEKPQQEAETDLPDEETYIDSFNLALHHDTTFNYTPLGSSDLVLQASASVDETGFTSRSGLRPHERFDLPFGVGWTSNLCSYIEVVENIGAEFNDPVAVNVIDEAGRPQRFGTCDFTSFFPWPSSRVDKKTYLNTLTRNGTTFTLQKKYGNTLTYTKCKTWFMYSSDRVEGSTSVRRHTYWRLAEVRDRYGARLQYDYDSEPGVPNDVSLIPRKISSPDRENQFLVIERSTDSRRVEVITDSRGNTTSFHYDFSAAEYAIPGGSCGAWKLTGVSYEDGTSTGYGYESAVEQETDNSDPQNTRLTYYYHTNLKSVTDKRSNTHTFNYGFDQSKQYWNSSVNGTRCTIDLDQLPTAVQEQVETELANRNSESHGQWKTMYGLPRRIASVVLPGGIGSSTFAPQGQMQFCDTVSFTSLPSTTVTDAGGQLTVYNFTDMLAELVDVDSTDKSISKEWMVYYLTSSIHHGGAPGSAGYIGTETYQFDPASGLSLWRATDLSGNVTTWEYDNGEGGNDYTNAGIRNSLTGAQTMSKWPDPIAKVDALNRRETYTYNAAFRVMDGTDDPYATTTTFSVDGLGRRRTKNVQSGNASLSQERYDYDNQRFKAFQTGKTILATDSVSGQNWETDLETAYLPDNHGRLWREIIDPDGEKIVTEHSYDFNNNRTSTLDARGNRTRFVYDKLNRLIETTYPSAGTIGGDRVTKKQIWYNQNGNKAAAIDEEEHYTIYHYDSLNRLVTTIRDMDGQGLPTRNDEGIVTETTKGSATGNDLVSRVVYNAVGSVTHRIDPRGVVTRTFYDAIQRPVHVFTGLTETEANGTLASCTTVAAASNEKTHTEFKYTDSALIFPRGGTMKGNPGGTAFDSSGFKPTLTIRYAAVRTATGTADLHTYAAYDALYRPVRTETEYETGVFAAATTTYGTIDGQKESLTTTSTDDRGKITSTTKDGLQRPVSVTDALDTDFAATTRTFYSSTGLVWKTIDPMDRETETEFDGAARPVKVWQPDPATKVVNRTATNDPLLGSPCTRTAYDKNNNITLTLNPLGYRWEYEYDARNRKTVERQPTVTQTEIVNGQAAETPFINPVIRTGYDGAGNVITVADARNAITRTFRDNAYRVTDVLTNPVMGNPSTDPLAPGTDDIVVHTSLDANGNAFEVVDGNGNATRNTFDLLNRLATTATNPFTGQPSADPASPAANDITVWNQYDDSNNLTKVTDGEGHVTGFRYDGLNRKTRTIWDEGSDNVKRTEQSSYDGIVMLSRIDPANQETTYEYDALNRLENVLYTGAAQVDNRHHAYDLAGNLLTVTYPNESPSRKILRGIVHKFDMLNRLEEETSAGSKHVHTYDKAGNRRTTTYAVTGRYLVSTYDKLNRLLTCVEKSAVNSQNESLTSYAYDLGGNITRKILPNGTVTQCTFDALSRKLSESTKTATGGLVSSFDYSASTAGYPNSYDKVGNTLKIVEFYGRTDVRPRTVTNTYDHTYRLQTESLAEVGGTSNTTTFGYDKANNRTSKVVTGDNPSTEISAYGQLTDNYNSNQLKTVTRGAVVIGFQYYPTGGRSVKQVNGVTTQTYTYDRENRLTSLVDTTKGTFNYTYDHRTRRVGRDELQAGGQSDDVSFAGGLSVQEYTTGSGTPDVETIRGSDYGGGIGGVLYTIRGSARSYNAYNSRGDVVSQTNGSAAITWQSTYEAFGTRTQEQGATYDRQRANTKDEDAWGALNEGMRYRDLEYGVFLTRDPAGFVDGPNVYTYVRQNPWTAVDPEGLFLDTIWDVGNVLYDGAAIAWNVGATIGGGAVSMIGAATGNRYIEEAGAGEVRQAMRNLGKSAVDVGTDAVAAAVPFVPAGASKIVRKADKVVDTVDNIKDGKKLLDKGKDVVDSARHIEEKSKAAAETATDAAKKTAAEVRAENIAKGIPESQLGPSGKPKVHVVEKSTRKETIDAAREAGGSKPIKHTQDKGQPTHYHPVDADGNKLTGNKNVHFQERGAKPNPE